ncbi:MAG: hypothetical protein RLW62_02585 [Gammaproteobacteria bacterium]
MQSEPRMARAMKSLCAGAFVMLLGGAVGCDVDQTQEAKLPDVDVEGGQMPKYDVQPADVDVQTETRTVEVPDVDVGTEEVEVTVPDVDMQSEEVEMEVPTGIEITTPPDDGNERVND